MKKLVKSSIDQDFPPVKLYLDDVEEIVDSFKEISEKEVMISTDEYSVDAVSELSEIHHIKELTIQSYSPYLRLGVTRHCVSLSSPGSSSTQMRGVATKISDILKSRTRLYPLSLLSTASPFLGVAWGFLISLGLISIAEGVRNKQLWLFPLGSAVTVLGMVMGYAAVGLGSRIISKKRSAEESFWQRNKDTLVVSTIMLFLGALLTFLAQLGWKLLLGP